MLELLYLFLKGVKAFRYALKAAICN